MLCKEYVLEVISPPCDPGSERWSAFVRLQEDISEVMPYLNTIWKNAIYDHENHILTLVRGGRRYTLRPMRSPSATWKIGRRPSASPSASWTRSTAHGIGDARLCHPTTSGTSQR